MSTFMGLLCADMEKNIQIVKQVKANQAGATSLK